MIVHEMGEQELREEELSGQVVHHLNGQLIDAVCDLLNIRGDDQCEWIINAIVVRMRESSDEEILTLNNSATLHSGQKFYYPEQCGPGERVKWLDGEIPISDSIAGYAAKSGEVAWVDNIFEHDYWAERYRDYVFVGVDTDRGPSPRRPTNEYAFPIKSTFNMVMTTFGVLNFEHYPNKKRHNPFQHYGRESIAGGLSPVLRFHSSFLALALQLDGREPIEKENTAGNFEAVRRSASSKAKETEDPVSADQHLLDCHKQVITQSAKVGRELLHRRDHDYDSKEHSSDDRKTEVPQA